MKVCRGSITACNSVIPSLFFCKAIFLKELFLDGRSLCTRILTPLLTFFVQFLNALTTSTVPWLLLVFSLPTSLPLLFCPCLEAVPSHVPDNVLLFPTSHLLPTHPAPSQLLFPISVSIAVPTVPPLVPLKPALPRAGRAGPALAVPSASPGWGRESCQGRAPKSNKLFSVLNRHSTPQLVVLCI